MSGAGHGPACRNASEVSGAIFPIQAFSMTFFRSGLSPLPESGERPEPGATIRDEQQRDFFIIEEIRSDSPNPRLCLRRPRQTGQHLRTKVRARCAPASDLVT
jgi:hypothetical protein